ncbi:MAG: hypothetical protein V3S69_03875 [Dehalococcoidales bacterium]
MQNKRQMQAPWIPTQWDLQMQAVRDRLDRKRNAFAPPRKATTKANSYYYIANKEAKVEGFKCYVIPPHQHHGKALTVYEGRKKCWYSDERMAKDSWLPEPVEDIIAKITK